MSDNLTLTAPVVAGGRVYFGSLTSPYIYCVDEKGNGDGTTESKNPVQLFMMTNCIYSVRGDGYMRPNRQNCEMNYKMNRG